LQKKQILLRQNKKGDGPPSPFPVVFYGFSLLVALFASGRPFLHIGMAPFADFVGEILAEAFDLAGTFFMALLAVSYGCLVGFVIEFHPFFHLDDVRSECRTGKDNDKQGHYGFFH